MHEDLLRQARRLSQLDPRRPRQANLRRAVSSCYYGLFHFLVHTACCASMGTRNDVLAYRRVLGRAFAHGTMKMACVSFAGGTLKATVRKGLPDDFVVAEEIQSIAQAFVDLQEMRHVADYDLSETFSRSDVLSMIQEVEAAIEGFRRLPNSSEKKFFVACLWAWDALAKR